jgi:predicted transcriptional regulator
MKTAAEILRAKPRTFNFVAPATRVTDALQLLNSTNCSFLTVMEEGEFKGIFSEHNFVVNVAILGWDASSCDVKSVMNSSLPVADMDTPIEELVSLLDCHHIWYIPVFDGHRFEGVITVNDILQVMLRDREALEGMKSGSYQHQSLG